MLLRIGLAPLPKAGRSQEDGRGKPAWGPRQRWELPRRSPGQVVRDGPAPGTLEFAGCR